MANVADSKQVFAQQMIAMARQLLLLAEQMDDINACFSVHGFNSGGSNAFQDSDFGTGSNQHLTAAIVDDTMFAIGIIVGAISNGVRNSLRECLPGGLP